MSEQQQEPLMVALKSIIASQVDPAVAASVRSASEAKQIVEQMSATLNKQRDDNTKAIGDQIGAGLSSMTSAIGKLENRVASMETSLNAKIQAVADENKLKRKRIVDYLKATPE